MNGSRENEEFRIQMNYWKVNIWKKNHINNVESVERVTRRHAKDYQVLLFTVLGV